MNPPTPKEQIEALQSELIQLRKRGDRTESRQDNRHAESEILGKLGIAYYQDQEWHSAIATLTEYLNLARELGNQTNEAVAHYYLGFTQQAIAEFEQAVAAFFQGYRLFRQLHQHEFAAQLWQQLVQQGQRYLQNQQVPEAVALYKRQIQVLLEFDDLKASAEIAVELGKVYYSQPDFPEAIACFTSALDTAQTLKDQTLENVALAWLGCSHWQGGDLSQGLQYLEQRLALVQQLENTAAQQETLTWLIQICQQLDHPDKLIQSYQLQANFWQQQGEPVNQHLSLYELAIYQFNRQQYPEALSGFQVALELANTLNDDQGKSWKTATNNYMLGECYRNLGENQAAISPYQQAVELYLQLGAKEWAEKGLGHLLNLYRELQQAEQEIDCQKKRFQLIQDRGENITAYSLAYGIGNLYNNRQQFIQALEYYQEALILAKNVEPQQNLANAAYMVGQCYRNLGQQKAAISGYEQAVGLYLQVGVKEWAEKGLEHLLNLYRELQQAEQEIDCQKKRFQLIQDKGEDIKAQSLAYEIGKLYNRRQQFIQALEYYQEALILAKKLEQQKNLANAAYMVGQCYRNLGQQQAAISGYEQAVGLYVEVKDTKWALSGLDYLVNLYRELRQYEEVIASYQRRLEIFRELGDAKAEQWCLYNIGSLYDDLKQWENALEYFDLALSLAQKLELQHSQANAYYMQGQCCRNLGQQQAAISGYAQAVELYVEVKETKWALLGLDYLVNLYRELKQDEQVIASYQRRLEIFRELADRTSEHSCLYDLASFQFDCQQYQEALSDFKSALQIAETLTEDRNQTYKFANSRYMMGQCCQNLGQQQAAIAHYQQATRLYIELEVKDWAAKALEHQGTLQKELNNYEQALAAQEQRLGLLQELNEPASKQSCLYNIGCILNHQKQWTRAIEYFGQALSLAVELEQKQHEANAHYMLAQCYESIGDFHLAEESTQRAKNLYQSLGNDEWEEICKNSLSRLAAKANQSHHSRGGQGLNIEQIIQQVLFWQQLRQAEMEEGTAAVHQVMRQNMELIVPALGDTIAHWMQEFVTQYPDQTEGVAGLVEDTCTSIRLFPDGRYGEALAIAIRGYDVVLALWADNPEGRAQTLTNLGNAHLTQAKFGINPAANLEQAITHYTEAAQIRRRPGLEKDLATTLTNLGNAHLIQAQFGINPASNLNQAITHYTEAAQIMRHPGRELDLARTLSNLGSAHANQAEFGINPAVNLNQAITHYTEAAQIMRHPGLEKDLATTLNNLGNAQLNQAEFGINPASNLNQAITHYREAAQIQRRPELEKDLAGTLNNLGNAHRNQAEFGINPASNLDQAIAHYTEAAQIRRRPGLEKDLAGTLNNLGLAHQNQAQFGINPVVNLDQAIAHYTEAALISRRLGLEKDLASTLNNLGNAQLNQAEFGINPAANLNQAITHYREAAQIQRRPGLEKDLATTLNNLGGTHANQAELGINPTANLDQAITALTEAAQIRRRLGLELDLATTLTNLGTALSNQAKFSLNPASNLDQAIAHYTEAAQILRRPGLESNLASTLTNLGNAHWNQAQFGINPAANLDHAIAHYTEAVQIQRRPGLELDLATTLTNLGVTHANQAEFGINLAANLKQAIAHYREAAQIRRRPGLEKDLATTLNNLGFAYQQESQHYKDDPNRKPTALNHAYRSFAEALEQVEYLRGSITTEDYKRNFNEQWNRIYRGIVEVCLELGNYTAAISYADRSKARNLAELMATKDLYPEGIDADTHQQLQALRQAMIAEDRRLQQHPNPDYTHLNQLRQEFQEKFPYKPLHFEQIQGLLDEETAILEWYILPDKFLTFTLTRQSLNLWTSSEKDFKNLIDWTNAYLNDYRNNKTQWHNNLPQRLEQLAQILHLDEILHNLREKFPNCKKLILIPHRFLHLFPLHALPVPVIATDGVGAQCLRPISRQNGNQEGLRIAPLQELFPKGVAYAPNCQVLQQAQKRINQRSDFNQLFAIQNPTQDLDFTDIEVAAIQSLFNPHHILQYDAAEKAAILDGDNLKNAHCTHFSCHGYFNFEDALKSALLLAKSEFTPPPPNEDQSRYIPLQNGNLLDLGKCLTIEDILRLDLSNCRLVTLSACETGITDFNSTSDEYIGLPSGFILAGAPNVVCSLWAVNDLSTALLMIRFYQNVKSGETVPLALKQAQIWLRDVTVEGLQVWSSQLMLRSTYRGQFRRRFSKMEGTAKPFASPYYWAGFCAIGA